MADPDAPHSRTHLTVDSLRTIAESVARGLRGAGELGAASVLEAAVRSTASPPEEVLAIREALIGTRLQWRDLDEALESEAAAALAEAKRLSISL